MMNYRIKPSKDRTHIVLKIKGEFRGEHMIKYIVEAHTLGKEMGINNYLVDVTEARNIDSTINNYQFAVSEMKMADGIDRQARVVALISEGDHSHDFVVNVLNKAGQSFRVFTNPDIARAYLKN